MIILSTNYVTFIDSLHKTGFISEKWGIENDCIALECTRLDENKKQHSWVGNSKERILPTLG
jgi:hypothetical protein